MSQLRFFWDLHCYRSFVTDPPASRPSHFPSVLPSPAGLNHIIPFLSLVALTAYWFKSKLFTITIQYRAPTYLCRLNTLFLDLVWQMPWDFSKTSNSLPYKEGIPTLPLPSPLVPNAPTQLWSLSTYITMYFMNVYFLVTGLCCYCFRTAISYPFLYRIRTKKSI